MPYVSIRTNQAIDDSSQQESMKKFSAFIAELLGKPEQYVMISIRAGVPLIFGGTDAPTAFVELKSIGLPRDRCGEFAAKISDFVQAELGPPPDRVFIDFKELERDLFAWNGKTF